MARRQEGTSQSPRHTKGTDGPAEVSAAQCDMMRGILGRVGDKWSLLVILMLRDGTRRFSELRRMIHGISQRMLTLTLRGLERDGLVTREVFPTVPPRVDYSLTERGRSLMETVTELATWALRHGTAIEKSRAAFDKSDRERARKSVS